MSTNSTIALEYDDGSVKQIYCHWDGYLDGVGSILAKHYADLAKVDQLMQLGDLSSLYAEIGNEHDFDHPPEGVCTFYGRDRGEKNVSANKFKSLSDYFNRNEGQQYDYVMTQRYGWMVRCCFTDGEFITLQEAFEREAAEEAA